MEELNESKIDRFNNSVRCGFCKMKWGLERWNDEYPFSCKRCGIDMVKLSNDPMPVRDFLGKLIKKTYGQN
ncbi:MAG: hypothetical protein WC711_04310 [Candidatus Staskawiczbacteria bacterium]|jgi:hypothetical protein